ncbi:hypothetical protein ACWIUH_01410 [Ursidibacter arcticus]
MATKEVKLCIVDFFKRYLDSLIDNGNLAIQTFNQRPTDKKVAIVPGRLIDQHEEMLNKWREKGVNGVLSPLPVFLIAFGKDYSASGLEKGRSVAMDNFVVKDNNGDYFNVRLSKHDQRVNFVLYAPDHETAFLLADQFKLFCAKYENRHSDAYYSYNGKHYPFPVTIEDNNVFGMNQQIVEQDNLTVLAFDVTFSCNTPYFVGDRIQNTPYLPVVQAVVIQDKRVNDREIFFKSIEGKVELLI